MSESSEAATAAYDSLAAFYQDTHAPFIQESRPAGRAGAVMMVVRQPAGDFSDPPTPDLVLSELRAGHVRSTIDVGAGRFEASAVPRHTAIIPPNVATTFLVNGRHEVRFLAIPYGGLRTLCGEESGLPPDGDFGSVHASLLVNDDVSGLLARMWDEAKSGSPAGALWADGALLQLAAALLRLSGRPRTAPDSGLAPWQLRRVTDYLLAQLDCDVGLAELSALIGLSPNHFCTAFRQSTGQPPAAWLLARRIERAQEMMVAAPRLGLTEVALAVGYGSQSAFGAAFRRVTGTTPSAWRRRN